MEKALLYFRIVALLAFGLLAGNEGWCQSSFGQVAGTVKDPSGASVAGATVTITSANTQAKRTLTTDESGNYIATNLPIGGYSISVVYSGFRTAQRRG